MEVITIYTYDGLVLDQAELNSMQGETPQGQKVCSQLTGFDPFKIKAHRGTIFDIKEELFGVRDTNAGTFDNLYPDLCPILGTVFYEGTELVKTEEARPCWHCQRETSFADINFMAYLCSPACVRAKWEEYRQACEEE